MANPTLAEFEVAIGKLIIAWAVMEQILNACLQFLHRDHKGHEIETDLPEPLSRRLKYFKKALRASSVDEDWVEYGVKLAGEIKALSVVRHDCIHGVLSTFFDEQAPPSLMVFRPPTQSATNSPISLEKISDVEFQAMRIGVLLSVLVFRQLHPVSEEAVKELLSELPGQIVAAIKKA